MLHLNVGPSALALGLLIPMTLDAGLEVCVICKPGKQSPTDFGISRSGPGGSLTFRKVGWFEGPDKAEHMDAEVQDRIASMEPLLITGSLREAIAKRNSFIVEVLQRRPRGAETVVIACENAPHGGYEMVREACERTGALMLRTVVNRMCVELPCDDKDRRIVSVHPLGEWLVERPRVDTCPKTMEALSDVDGFELVDDIEARHDRKLWMVNGAHQALALMARRGKGDYRLELGEDVRSAASANDDLRAAMEDPRVAVLLGHLHNAMNEALRLRHPALSGSIEYSLEHVLAYAEHPDSVARVLSAFRRLRLLPFLKALDERIAEPARICYEHGRSVEPFSYVIDVFLELVAHIDFFADNVEVRRTAIDLYEDVQAVQRFERLVTPWAGDAIDKLTGHFAQLLADHRGAYEP